MFPSGTTTQNIQGTLESGTNDLNVRCQNISKTYFRYYVYHQTQTIVFTQKPCVHISNGSQVIFIHRDIVFAHLLYTYMRISTLTLTGYCCHFC